MTAITDQFMKDTIAKAKRYAIVILKKGPAFDAGNTEHLIWEHGRRNFELRAAGLLPIVCPVNDKSEVCGIAIFTGSGEEVHKIMDGDPAVAANIFVYEVHACRSFPGDALP